MVTSTMVARHLGDLHAKVEEVAERAGVPENERSDLRSALAALPWRDRRRLGIVFESVRAHAVGADLREAVRLIVSIAGDVWGTSPPPRLALPIPAEEGASPSPRRRPGS